MPLELFLALVGFAFVTSATPGPNTMMLLASGVNFGFKRTLPHILGVACGFGLMLLIVGLGLGAAILASPTVASTLKIASVLYMLWLAWRIANAGSPDAKDTRGRPMSFVEAALFQWVNPKAWAIALAGVASYTVPASYGLSLAIFVAVFILLNVPIAAAWTGFGVALRSFLADPLRLRLFNVTMALLLVASLWPLAREWL